MKKVFVILCFCIGIHLYSNGNKEEILAEYNNATAQTELQMTDSFIRSYGSKYNQELGDFAPSRIQLLVDTTFNKALEPGLELSNSDLDNIMYYVEMIPEWSSITGTNYSQNMLDLSYERYSSTIKRIADLKRDKIAKEAKEAEIRNKNEQKRILDNAIELSSIDKINDFINNYPESEYIDDAIEAREEILKETRIKEEQSIIASEKNKAAEEEEEELKEELAAYSVPGLSDGFLNNSIRIRANVVSDVGVTVKDFIYHIDKSDGKECPGGILNTKYSLDGLDLKVVLEIDNTKLYYTFHFNDIGYISRIDIRSGVRSYSAESYEDKLGTMGQFIQIIYE